MNKVFAWIKDHAATLLSCGATIGTVGGAVAAVKAAPKAAGRIQDAEVAKVDRILGEKLKANGFEGGWSEDEELNSKLWQEAIEEGKLTVWEKIKAGAPAFLIPALIEGATIGCIHGSNLVNKREISALNRTITGLNESLAAGAVAFAAYKDGVGRITDRTTEFAAQKYADEKAKAEENGDAPWDEVRTFYIEGQPEFFDRTMDQVFKAEVALNRKFAIQGFATINDFYRMLDLPEIAGGDERGFEAYLGEVYYGYRWIDFSHLPYQTEDGLWVTEIAMPVGPHPLDEDEANRELDEAIGLFNKGLLDARKAVPTDQPDPRFG